MFPEKPGFLLGALSLLDKIISRTHSEGSLRTILFKFQKKKIPEQASYKSQQPLGEGRWRRKRKSHSI